MLFKRFMLANSNDFEVNPLSSLYRDPWECESSTEIAGVNWVKLWILLETIFSLKNVKGPIHRLDLMQLLAFGSLQREEAHSFHVLGSLH